MNSIFLNSFSFRYLRSNDGYLVDRWQADCSLKFSRDIRLKFLYDTITSILLHDEIVIKIDAVEEMVDLLGFNEFMLLIEEGIVRIIDDQGISFQLMELNLFKKYDTRGFVVSTEPKLSIKSVKERLGKQFGTSKLENINKSIKCIDGEQLGFDAQLEFYEDFQNPLIRKNFNIKTEDIDNINIEDSLTLFCLLNTNSSFNYMREAEISNVYLDEVSKLILELKYANKSPLKKEDSIKLFKKINEYKKIPDYSILYSDGKIGIEDILKVRNSFLGKKFREWFYDTDYNENDTFYELMKLHDKGNVEKGIRFTITNIFGIINPVLGMASSAVDSLIWDKLFGLDWSPNLFLENVLRKNFDERSKI